MRPPATPDYFRKAIADRKSDRPPDVPLRFLKRGRVHQDNRFCEEGEVFRQAVGICAGCRFWGRTAGRNSLIPVPRSGCEPTIRCRSRWRPAISPAPTFFCRHGPMPGASREQS